MYGHRAFSYCNNLCLTLETGRRLPDKRVTLRMGGYGDWPLHGSVGYRSSMVRTKTSRGTEHGLNWYIIGESSLPDPRFSAVVSKHPGYGPRT